MIFLALFAITLAAYWLLRVLDYRSTVAAQALGAFEGRESVRTNGYIDAKKFIVPGVIWTGFLVALFVFATLTTALAHAAWLGVAGVLIVRSVTAIHHNQENIRKLQAGATGQVQPGTGQAATGASELPNSKGNLRNGTDPFGAEADQPRRGGSRRNHG